MKNILSKVITLAILCLIAYFGFQKYQENSIKKFNESYVESVKIRLSASENIEQKIEILEDEIIYSGRPPQNEKISLKTRENLQTQLQELKEKREELKKDQADEQAWKNAQKQDTEKGYRIYISKAAKNNGKYVMEATKKEKVKILERLERLKDKMDIIEKPVPAPIQVVNKGRHAKQKTLFITNLICNKQREVEIKNRFLEKHIPTSDNIKITVNGVVKSEDNMVMVTTDRKDLRGSISGLQLTSTSHHTIQIIELDNVGNEVLFDLSFTGDDYKEGVYSEVWEGFVGKYTLVYEIR